VKKWIFSVALLISLDIHDLKFQKMISHPHEVVPGRFSPNETQYLTPEAVHAGYLSVKGMKIDGFSGESLKKLNTAFTLLEKVVNSNEFKDRVINFKNRSGLREYASNKGLTNEEIYQIFMEGRETLQPNTPGEMNYYLKLYYNPFSRVIGYTSGDTNLININWRFFKNYQPSDVAANLAHEWVHKIGFDHASAKEHDSAPYAIGYIVGDMAKRILKSNQLIH
jgi:hypothetical protein